LDVPKQTVDFSAVRGDLIQVANNATTDAIVTYLASPYPFNGSNYTANSTSATSVTVGFSISIASDIYVCVQNDNNANVTVTDDVGNTYALAVTQFSHNLHNSIYHLDNVSNTAITSITAAGTNVANWTIEAFPMVNTTNPSLLSTATANGLVTTVNSTGTIGITLNSLSPINTVLNSICGTGIQQYNNYSSNFPLINDGGFIGTLNTFQSNASYGPVSKLTISEPVTCNYIVQTSAPSVTVGWNIVSVVIQAGFFPFYITTPTSAVMLIKML